MTGLNRAEALNQNSPTRRSAATSGGASKTAKGHGPSGDVGPVPLSPEERDALEQAHPDGVQLGAILALLHDRGVQLSEATFRKYVQLGLLPRSRRVGRKGKHRGSHGLYPVDCVSRIIEIKALMEAGRTLEEIQRSALAIGADIDLLRRTAETISQRLELALSEAVSERGESRAIRSRRKGLGKSLTQLRGQASDLIKAMENATIEISALDMEADETRGTTDSSAVRGLPTLDPSSNRTPANLSASHEEPGSGRNHTRGTQAQPAERGTAKRHEEHFE